MRHVHLFRAALALAALSSAVVPIAAPALAMEGPVVLSGTVTNKAGNPVAGAYVTVAERGPAGKTVASTRTDSAGRYSFDAGQVPEEGFYGVYVDAGAGFGSVIFQGAVEISRWTDAKQDFALVDFEGEAAFFRPHVRFANLRQLFGGATVGEQHIPTTSSGAVVPEGATDFDVLDPFAVTDDKVITYGLQFGVNLKNGMSFSGSYSQGRSKRDFSLTPGEFNHLVIIFSGDAGGASSGFDWFFQSDFPTMGHSEVEVRQIDASAALQLGRSEEAVRMWVEGFLYGRYTHRETDFDTSTSFMGHFSGGSDFFFTQERRQETTEDRFEAGLTGEVYYIPGSDQPFFMRGAVSAGGYVNRIDYSSFESNRSDVFSEPDIQFRHDENRTFFGVHGGVEVGLGIHAGSGVTLELFGKADWYSKIPRIENVVDVSSDPNARVRFGSTDMWSWGAGVRLGVPLGQ